MKILLQCLLFLSCNALAVASEIIAWKTPFSAVAPEGLYVPGVTRLEKPPEASPFFGPKDELWNISTLMSRHDRALSEAPEWVVWNATSGRIVAKISWAAFVEIQYKWNLQNPPVQCRVKIDVYQVATVGSPPDSSKPPKLTLSAVTRAGHKTIASYSEIGANIGLECEATFSEDRSLVDLRTFISVSLPDGPTSKFNTSVTLLNGLQLWLARESDGKNGIDIMVKTTFELVDGTPFSEAVMRQEGNGIMSFPGEIKHGNSDSIAIGEKGRLIWSTIRLSELLGLLGAAKFPGDERIEDPFAAVGDKELEKMVDESKLKTITVPEFLAPHVHGSVLDISDLVKRLGLTVLKGDLVGYDFKTQRIFMYSSDIKQSDIFEQLFLMGCRRQPNSLVITARGNGELRLISRSGIKSSIESNYPESKQTRFFQVEPSLGENDTYVDASFTFHDKIGEQIMNSMQSSAMLETGKFLKLLEKGKADGSKEAMEMKVEVMKHQR